MSKAKPHKTHKGKQHPAHSASFLKIAEALGKASRSLMPEANQAVQVVARVIREEGERLRKIVR